MVKGIIVQKGSFNPLHRMHKSIADDAMKKWPEYPHTFLLSTQTCDKGEVTEEELKKRALAIKQAGFEVAFSKSGLFIDTIKEIRNTLGADTVIIFPVGEDTLQRFFRDWHDYYVTHTGNNHWMIYDDYKVWFRNVIWYVSKRETEERKFNFLVQAFGREHPNIMWSDLNLDDISSTKIRESLKQ